MNGRGSRMGNWRVKAVITGPSINSELISCSKYSAELKFTKMDQLEIGYVGSRDNASFVSL